ncbi:MAG: hypothetical protein F4W90_11900 [Gammaproteobacteria bacterium]|nr:hypothetical protein [Gammaproteobacteria bacterium]
MNRRELLLGSAASTGFAALPSRAAPLDETYQSFHRNLLTKPWLRLYEGVHEEDTGYQLCEVEGTWPAGLVGSLYRNGPGRMERDGRRYQHWFDGDGLLQRWWIDGNGAVLHRARLIQTTKYLADERRNELSRVGFGTHSNDPIPGPPGTEGLNVANISILPRADELWALWEGGAPWRINPQTLRTTGLLALSDETSGLPFSAHPRVESDGTVWNFGYFSPRNMMIIWRLRPGDIEPKIWLHLTEPMSMPHDFLITKNHLVIPLPPLHFELQEDMTTFLDAHVWHPELPVQVMVLDKNDPNKRFNVELPTQWIFHYANAWEDEQGAIRFEGPSFDNPNLMFDTFRAIMRGSTPSLAYTSQLTRYTVDTRRQTATQEAIGPTDVSSEFPVIDQRLTGARYRWLTMLSQNASASTQGKLGMFNGVSRINLDTGAVGSFQYPTEEAPEEHLFVPKPGSQSETDGWLLGTSLDYVNLRTHLNVFELEQALPKMVARATLPKLMPLGLHGKFVAAT